MTALKCLLIKQMEHTCYLIDKLPNWTYHGIGRWIGCPNGFARWAFMLEDRWNLTDEMWSRYWIVGTCNFVLDEDQES